MTCLVTSVRRATESKKKIFALMIMMTAFSLFVSCSAEEKDIALSERVGTYKGIIPTGNLPVEINLSNTTGDAGKIDVDVNNGTTDSVTQTASQMAATGTTFDFVFPIMGKVTVEFDSATEATGAKASFNTTPNNNSTKVTVTLVKQ